MQNSPHGPPRHISDSLNVVIHNSRVSPNFVEQQARQACKRVLPENAVDGLRITYSYRGTLSVTTPSNALAATLRLNEGLLISVINSALDEGHSRASKVRRLEITVNS